MNFICAWSGCQRTAPAGLDLPVDWRWLITSRKPVVGVKAETVLSEGRCDRDGALCPDHVAALEALLKSDATGWR